jgi:hypothetical protein
MHGHLNVKLEWILKKSVGGRWLDLCESGQVQFLFVNR